MIYFDNAATSFPKAPGVAEAMADAIHQMAGNVGRSSSKNSLRVAQTVFDCREKIAEMMNISDSQNVVFTAGATESLNLLLHGLIQSENRVLTTPMEHNSVLRPLFALKERLGIEVHFIRCNDQGYPNIDDYQTQLQAKPDLVITTAASNVTGTVFPFYTMAKMASEHNIPFILDAAQTGGTIAIDCAQPGLDAVCFAGHKGLMGPSGIGFCYISETIDPVSLKQGGTGSRSDKPQQPDFRPDKFESGTLNIPGIAGLSAAIDFIAKTGIATIHTKKKELFTYFYARLSKLSEITIFTDPNYEQTGIISIGSSRYSVAELTEILDQHDIDVRMGLHCAPMAHQTINTFSCGGTVRFSMGYFNTYDQIDHVCDLLEKLHR